MSGGRVALLIVDLDGTVRHSRSELGRFVNGPEDVVIFPEAQVMLDRWTANGGRVMGVTNQGGIALGYTDVARVEDAILRTNVLCGMAFATIQYCPHYLAPPGWSCWCRKPRPGMVYQGLLRLAEVYGPEWTYPPDLACVVGDRDEDAGLARAIGVEFVSAAEWRRRA